MSSRRGAVRINPVTGKMEKYDPKDAPDGVTRHRDGALIVDERYINAAREIGLGGEQGMYGHIKSLVRMNAADIPTGSSMQREGQYSSGNRGSRPAVDPKNTNAVASAMGSEVKRIGGGRVHGFSTGSRPKASDIHVGHASAFNRQKGVVNTFGGAKSVNRQRKESPPRLPPKGERKTQIMGFSTLDAHTAEGKARRAAAEKRSATGNGPKHNMVHVSGGGGRISGFNGPVKPANRFGQSVSANSSASTRSKSRPAASASSATAGGGGRTTSTAHVLGGSTAGGQSKSNTADAAAIREKRANYFAKMFDEREKQKKEAMGVL